MVPTTGYAGNTLVDANIRELDHFNLRARYKLNENIEFGVSGQLGSIYNKELNSRKWGISTALHIVADYNKWNFKGEFISYNYNAQANNKEKLDILQMAAYGAAYDVATKGNIYILGLAYMIPINRKFIKYIQPYDINSELMTEYEAYLRSNGVSQNSSSFYMRILRAVYNRSVEKGLTEQKYPFRYVYTGIEKTIKRAVSFKVIKQIRDLDLAPYPTLDYVRDMFLFSFYTRGMSFVDMAYLKKKDLSGGVLSYRRKKTGQQLFIKWEQCMQDIVDKYPPNESSYLLPIIKSAEKDERSQYKNASCLINRNLKIIGSKLGLSIPLTMYVARHSWASIAKSKNIPVTVISEGMGHDSEVTTQIYLAALDTSIIDRANNMILKPLL